VKRYRAPFITGLLVVLVFAGCGGPTSPPPVKQAEVDEFGVPLGDTPPPIPEGYESTQAVLAAAAAGKVKLVDRSEPAPESIGVVVRKGVEYGRVGERALLLDLYTLPDINEPAPGLIFIHGGGWSKGDRGDYAYYCTRFAKRGYIVATVSYRLSGEAKFPAAVQDVKCAVRWMRANSKKNKMDPNRIAVMGGSAGGYLALMAGYTSDVPELEGDGGNPGISSRVNVVVNAYGPTDLTSPTARTAPEVTRFLPRSYAEDPELFSKASPLAHLTRDDPPTLIFQGTVDELVPAAQNDALAAKCKEVGVQCTYVKFKGWPHTMDMAEGPNVCFQWYMLDFFKKHLLKK